MILNPIKIPHQENSEKTFILQKTAVLNVENRSDNENNYLRFVKLKIFDKNYFCTIKLST